MSYTGKIITALIVITIVAAIPIMTNVAKRLGDIPSATPINIPTAMKKSTVPDQTMASSSAHKQEYTAYFVALDDNGIKGRKIGCNDSLVSVTKTATGSAQLSVQEKLSDLLNYKNQYYEKTGLYNALYQSDVKVGRIQIAQDGTEMIYLIGRSQLNGICDTPRLIEQITQTAKEGNENKKVKIFLNGKSLQDALSQK